MTAAPQTTAPRAPADLPPMTAPDGRRIRRVSFSQRLSRWDFRLSPYLYVSPFFLLFGLTGLFPIVYTAFVSVHQWHLIGGQGDFVGLDNFAFVLAQPQFWTALRNTFSIFLFSSVPQIAIALVIAAALDQNLRAKTFWRMGVLLPYIVAPVAVSLIFTNLFGDQYGLVNRGLEAIGLSPVGWHADGVASHVAIATMVNFRWTGYNALILLAAMQAIPRDYYEASMIDGAGKVRQFFSITIPQLRPTLIFVIITSTIGGLQIFDEPRMFDQYGQGGADKQWMTITIYLYNLGWGQLDFGRAAAVAWLLFLLIVAIGLLNLAITRRIAASDDPRPTTRLVRSVRKGRS